MALTLEQINKGLEAMGKPPLDKLPENTPAKTQAEIDAEAAAAAEAAKAAEGQDGKQQTPPASTTTTAALTDEQVFEYLKSKGINAKSLDDLKTPEPQKTAEQIAEERENNKLSYALSKGLFNKKDYEGFISDSNAKEALVFADYAAEQKKDDPSLTDAELQEEFNEKYGLNAEVDSRKAKWGQKEIEMRAERILKNKYKKVYQADDSFAAHQTEIAEAAQKEKLYKEKTPAYKADVDELVTSLKKIPLKFSDTESMDVELIEDSIKGVKDHLLRPEVLSHFIEVGYTKEELKELGFQLVVRQNLMSIIDEATTQRMRNQQAGTRGIIPGGEKKAEDDKNKKKLTKEQQEMLDMYKPITEQTTAN